MDSKQNTGRKGIKKKTKKNNGVAGNKRKIQNNSNDKLTKKQKMKHSSNDSNEKITFESKQKKSLISTKKSKTNKTLMLSSSSSSSSPASPASSSLLLSKTRKSQSDKQGSVPLIYFDREFKEECKTKVSEQQKKFSYNDAKNWRDVLEFEDKGDKKMIWTESEKKCKNFMKWLLFPAMSIEEFEKVFFERKVFYIGRSACNGLENYYDGIFSSQNDIRKLLSSKKLEYQNDIDVTLYRNETRYTLNPSYPKVVDLEMVMDLFEKQKCSVRFLRPHQHVDAIGCMLAQMEEYFQMGAGCNAYWTPANSQGFSPHYDDVDVFILQLEGKKSWSLYQARDPTEILPLESSPNFSQDEVSNFLVTRIELKPGDLLYCPRGTIHQAVVSSTEEDSLHLTISTSFKMSWKNYLEIAIPKTLERVSTISQEISFAFHQALPRHYGDFMGLQSEQEENLLQIPMEEDGHYDEEEVEKKDSSGDDIDDDIDDDDNDDDDNDDDDIGSDFAGEIEVKDGKYIMNQEIEIAKREKWRGQFRSKVKSLMMKLVECMDLDEAADDMFIKFLQERQSPRMALSKEERRLVERQDQNKMPSKIRFLTKNVARLVLDSEETCSLVHSMKNTTEAQEVPQPGRIQFAIEYAPALQHLLTTYPEWQIVTNLPDLEPEERVALVRALLGERLVQTVYEEKN